jgi:hypothetical protein
MPLVTTSIPPEVFYTVYIGEKPINICHAYKNGEIDLSGCGKLDHDFQFFENGEWWQFDIWLVYENPDLDHGFVVTNNWEEYHKHLLDNLAECAQNCAFSLFQAFEEHDVIPMLGYG